MIKTKLLLSLGLITALSQLSLFAEPVPRPQHHGEKTVDFTKIEIINDSKIFTVTYALADRYIYQGDKPLFKYEIFLTSGNNFIKPGEHLSREEYRGLAATGNLIIDIKSEGHKTLVGRHNVMDKDPETGKLVHGRDVYTTEGSISHKLEGITLNGENKYYTSFPDVNVQIKAEPVKLLGMIEKEPHLFGFYHTEKNYVYDTFNYQIIITDKDDSKSEL